MRILDKKTNHRIGRVMHEWRMLAAGDRILIAVSGGIDSLVLTWLLDHWRRKTPFSYELLAVHIDMGFDTTSSSEVAEQLNRLAIPFLVDYPAAEGQMIEIDGCHTCSSLRRKRLFDLAARHDCNRLAFGHHADDMLETFFLNICYAGNISTLLPRQDLFGGSLSIIRPLAGLDKETVIRIGRDVGLTPVKNPCPFADDSRRQKVRDWLADLWQLDPPVRANMLAALGNVKPEYLPWRQPSTASSP